MSLAQLLPGIPHVESPLFPSFVDSLNLSNFERSIAEQLFARGYAVLDFPDDEIGARIDRIKARLAPVLGTGLDDPGTMKTGASRKQDAWKDDEDVRAIACNQAIMDLLGKLYGRRAFPFQTLNFAAGTQQHMHSDSVHFSSVPERFMCGVWLAYEDVGPEAGPLFYYPGTHKWPILTNEKLGVRSEDVPPGLAQMPYEECWRALIAQSGIAPETFHARKGQAVIWMANLLHGGSPQHDQTLTRWSQVTHYYFDGCTYYTPAYSQPAMGQLDVRTIEDVSTGKIVPNLYMGDPAKRYLPQPVKPGRLKRMARGAARRLGMTGKG